MDANKVVQKRARFERVRVRLQKRFVKLVRVRESSMHSHPGFSQFFFLLHLAEALNDLPSKKGFNLELKRLEERAFGTLLRLMYSRGKRELL